MTLALAAGDVAADLNVKLPNAVIDTTQNSLNVKPEYLLRTIAYLKETPELAFDYLTAMTAVDYWDSFELVYQLTSLTHNHGIVVKTRLPGRKDLKAASVVGLYQGADYQEREVHDLFGIKFEGHPNLKPIVLWEGFQGYPLRKDYL